MENSLTQSKFGEGLKNQLLFKDSINGNTEGFSIRVAAVNAGCAIGGFFLGNKLLPKVFPKGKGFLKSIFKGGN